MGSLDAYPRRAVTPWHLWQRFSAHLAYVAIPAITLLTSSWSSKAVEAGSPPKIAAFCLPSLGDEKSDPTLSQSAAALHLGDELAATAIVRIDPDRSEHGVGILPEFLDFYFLVTPDLTLLTCSGSFSAIQSASLNPKVPVVENQQEMFEQSQELFQFDVWTNCGTGCAYDSEYFVLKSDREIAEFYVVGTANDSDLSLRACPMTYEFKATSIGLEPPHVRGIISAKIECGEDAVLCAFDLPEKEIDLPEGDGIPFFQASGVRQFSPLEHPYVTDFMKAHEKQLAYPFEAASDLCH